MAEPATNRLVGEKSPYLLQHAHNPVDWYPWGDEAFAKARSEDRPVFLSVGYAACHWCHVMERESFEDPETAALLNARFVAVKVDREERPDVDGIYMDAVQAMTGAGGWPMSVFLTPDGKPFYAGTYFPDEPRHGMPAFRQVLEGIADAWETRRDEVEVQSARVTEAIAHAGQLRAADGALGEEIADAALERLRGSFDARWGGFGGAPKFPQPMTLEFLLRMALRGKSGALEMLVLTLDRMAAGGMFDQLGGGFARYSTDGAWHVPHFEKMLYDNAQLAQVYTRTWLVTGEERLREVALQTLEYLLRELRQPEGGFSSSQDADTEGVEGGTFTWTWDELTALVGEPVAEAFGAEPEGNWEGTNVLRAPVAIDAIAERHGADPEELRRAVAAGRHTLFAARRERAQPGVDDKVLTAWNALAIRALAEAGRAFDEPRYVEAAVACGGVRARAPARRIGAAVALLARRRRRGPRVRGRPRAARRRVPDAVRDDLRPAVVHRRPRAVPRPGAAVLRRGARGVLPNGHGRGAPRRAPEGPLRQRRARRELGGGGVPPAARPVHRGRRRRARGDPGARARPRRDGRGADGVRAGPRRARPVRRAEPRDRDRRRTGRRRRPGPSYGRPRKDSCRTPCSRSRVPATRSPRRRSRCWPAGRR